jgi:hypothetical protein
VDSGGPKSTPNKVLPDAMTRVVVGNRSKETAAARKLAAAV